MGDDDTFQPKSLLIHEVDFISNLQRMMGVINFNMVYSNFDSWGKLAYNLTFLVDEAISQNNINLKKRPDLIPNKDVIYKLRKLWDGQCYLTVEHGDFGVKPETELFHYDTSKIDYDNPALEVVPYIALSNLVPIDQLKEPTLLIQLHESMPNKYAWQSLSFADVVQDGNMMHHMSDGSTPKISQEQMESTTDLTRYVSRDIYFRLIHKEKNKFIRLWAIIYNNYCKMIEYVKLDDEEDEEEYDSDSVSIMG